MLLLFHALGTKFGELTLKKDPRCPACGDNPTIRTLIDYEDFCGVAPEEVNFKTMQSRLVPNLYIIGDALNIDRPSGGYSLQLCWTTGFVAGSSI